MVNKIKCTIVENERISFGSRMGNMQHLISNFCTWSRAMIFGPRTILGKIGSFAYDEI